MKRWSLGVVFLAAFAASPGAAHEGHDVSEHAGFDEPRPPHAFDRLASLVGEWVAAEDGGPFERGQLVSRYALTGGGSALVETLFPGSPHEMTTVYHRDGSDLVLTHYCASGNQPRMRVRAPATDASVFEFAFEGGTNLDASRDSHMHSLRLELAGPDALVADWQAWNAGRPDGPPAHFQLVRKK